MILSTYLKQLICHQDDSVVCLIPGGGGGSASQTEDSSHPRTQGGARTSTSRCFPKVRLQSIPAA